MNEKPKISERNKLFTILLVTLLMPLLFLSQKSNQELKILWTTLGFLDILVIGFRLLSTAGINYFYIKIFLPTLDDYKSIVASTATASKSMSDLLVAGGITTVLAVIPFITATQAHVNNACKATIIHEEIQKICPTISERSYSIFTSLSVPENKDFTVSLVLPVHLDNIDTTYCLIKKKTNYDFYALTCCNIAQNFYKMTTAAVTEKEAYQICGKAQFETGLYFKIEAIR